MKALFEQISSSLESSLTFLDLSQPAFAMPYHFHPQVELTWIRKSSGKRYIGQNVSNYFEGDLVLVGADTMHCWLSEGDGLPGSAQGVVLQFDPYFLGKTFWELPEMTAIRSLLQRAGAGVQIIGQTRLDIIEILESFSTATPFQRLIRCIVILNLIAVSEETVLIDNQTAKIGLNFSESQRFQKVFQYLIKNYNQEIVLEKVAEIAHLSPTAFCRFFKAITHKTLTEVVVDFRINQACSLLSNTDKPVSEVCFECGFGNTSYFNKKFKAVTGSTPLEYRKLFAKK